MATLFERYLDICVYSHPKSYFNVWTVQVKLKEVVRCHICKLHLFEWIMLIMFRCALLYLSEIVIGTITQIT